METALLSGAELFAGLNGEEIGRVLACLGAHTRAYTRGTVLCPAGGVTGFIGLVIKGSVRVEYQDAWGNRSLISQVGPGETYAEVFALLPGEPMPVSVVAASDCLVLRVQAAKLTQLCGESCAFHGQMIRNLLRIVSRRNAGLTRRMVHTAPKTIRARLMSYLSLEAARARSRRFDIPFDRQQLADYLGVDRSALSNELGKMRREGLLTTTKNRFELAETVDVIGA